MAWGDPIKSSMNYLTSAVGSTAAVTRAENSFDLAVIPAGKSKWLSTETASFIYQAGTRDFLCAAADYIIDEEAVDPEDGDQFVITIGGESMTYRVMTPPGADACFYSQDHQGSRLRIHTVEVSQ